MQLSEAPPAETVKVIVITPPVVVIEPLTVPVPKLLSKSTPPLAFNVPVTAKSSIVKVVDHNIVDVRSSANNYSVSV